MTIRPEDRRKEPRYSVSEQVRIVLTEPVIAEIRATLMDASASGFRVCHQSSQLQRGQQVRFQYTGIDGVARVIWNRIVDDHVESGFVILD